MAVQPYLSTLGTVATPLQPRPTRWQASPRPRSSGSPQGSFRAWCNCGPIRAMSEQGSGIILTADGRTAPFTVVATDPTTDIAVVQAQGTAGLTPIAMGSSSDLRVGQQVVRWDPATRAERWSMRVDSSVGMNSAIASMSNPTPTKAVRSASVSRFPSIRPSGSSTHWLPPARRRTVLLACRWVATRASGRANRRRHSGGPAAAAGCPWARW